MHCWSALTYRTSRQTTAVRQNIISVFLQRFTLTEAETESITSHDVPVGKQMFAAMDRAERIREDCSILLSGAEGAETKAGYALLSPCLRSILTSHTVAWTSWPVPQSS